MKIRLHLFNRFKAGTEKAFGGLNYRKAGATTNGVGFGLNLRRWVSG